MRSLGDIKIGDITIDVPDGRTNFSTEIDFVRTRGFILRAVKGYGFPNALRMTIGSEEANLGVIAALTEFMEVR